MSKQKSINNQNKEQPQVSYSNLENPFSTDKADELWEVIRQKGTPVTKEELLQRVEKQKSTKL